MIKRINFNEVHAFAITYQILAQVLVGVVVLNMAAAYWQGMKYKKLEPVLAGTQAHLTELQEEKKSFEKKPVIKKQANVEVGEYQDLFELLNAYPKWAGVIDKITSSLPNSVWLTGVTSSVTQKSAAPEIKPEGSDVAPAPTKPSNLITPETIKLNMTGLAADVDGLAGFVKNMQTSDLFGKTTIQESQKESFGYQFTVESFLNLNYVE